MIYDDIELHNVSTVTQKDGGVRLERIPTTVREALNENAQEMYTRPAGCEIRFECEDDGETVEVTLSSPEGECTATPCYGSFLASPDERVEIGSEPSTIELSVPDGVQELDPDLVEEMAFSPSVQRLVLRGDPVILHDVSGDVQPPRSETVPDCRYLAYGTSITQGLVATEDHLTYAGQTARRLDADLLNLGTSGSAYCENAIADHIASRQDWDVVTLALSVNMLGSGFTAEEFRERASYMVETIAAEHPTKPIVCITLFPVFPELCPERDGDWPSDTTTYREVLRKIVAESPHENVHLLEGPDLLTDVTGLAPDLVHPTDHGMIEIGHQLTDRLESILEER